MLDKCLCVGKHVPLPIELVEFHGITVCPTTYSNIQSLLKEYSRYSGRPPGSVRKHYSDFVQDLVDRFVQGLV